MVAEGQVFQNKIQHEIPTSKVGMILIAAHARNCWSTGQNDS